MAEWDRLFASRCAGLGGRFLARYGAEGTRSYLRPPSHWCAEGDRRLSRLRYDPDPAALGLCSLIESQTERLKARAHSGTKIIASLKDLSTVPALLAAADDAVCFSADMAYMQPCTSEDPRFLELAAEHGLGEDFCEVRAVVGAFADGDYWPRPDLCVAAAGACCDDFSACSQQVAAMGHRTYFWELPEVGQGPTEEDLAFAVRELEGVRRAIAEALGREIPDEELAEGLRRVNRLRSLLRSIREMAYAPAPGAAPLAALESLLVEALAVDYGSDLAAATALLEQVETLCRARLAGGENAIDPDAVRLTWVTPAMDLCLQNLMEDLGARVAGTEYMIGHGWTELDETRPPLEALAASALEDSMIGSLARRARRVADQAARYEAEGVVLVTFFGASHCAYESGVIAEELDLPVLTLDVRSAAGPVPSATAGRLESFIETLRAARARQFAAVERRG